MQALLPPLQSAPQEAAPQSFQASSSGSGSDFQSTLQAKMNDANAAAKPDANTTANVKPDANAAAKTDPSGKNGKAHSAQENAGQQQALIAAVIPVAKAVDPAPAKALHQADPKKTAKADPAVLGMPAPVNVPLPASPSGKASPGAVSAGNSAASDSTSKSSNLGSAHREALASQSAKGSANPADFSQAGNNLPAKQAKAPPTQVMVEKNALPLTKKTSETPTTTQPAAIAQQGESKAIPKLTVAAPVASPNWSNELGQKVAWMTSSGNHVAELHLNPPNLGPMEVKLTVHNDQATIQFVSQHQEVRTALESALPKLREMMMDSGISLGNASVDSGSSQQSGFGQQERSERSGGSLLSATGHIPVRISRSIGKVDTFA